MVEYTDGSIVPFPRDQLWKLLDAHWDDTTITQIRPLVRTQKTLSQSPNERVVERTVDARGKLVTSQGEINLRPPEYVRSEIISGNGPYEPGTVVETTYSDAPGGTHLQTHVKGRISVPPFILPQKLFFRRVWEDIDKEDEATFAVWGDR
jgi:hypothetical protein